MEEEVLSSEYSYEGRKDNLNKYFISKQKVKEAINKRLYKLRNIGINHSLSDLMKELSKDMEEFIEELGLE